jgi:hypothetical protein
MNLKLGEGRWFCGETWGQAASAFLSLAVSPYWVFEFWGDHTEGMWTGYNQSTYLPALELYVLTDDDMRCAIETCTSSESVLV